MQLPDALQPWRQWLTWFAPEQLPLFADLFGRLNPLLGPWRGRQQGGEPEPDGLGDLQRRGAYERLLSSEWLLAGEVPEEFLRRAVSGEHMFLAPQYRTQQASRLIVVLFDAGPLQLGAPRLVHLALLMLLARRAQEAGAELRWGILQEAPQLRPFDGVAQLKALLAARSWQLVGDEHWQAWRDWLGEQDQAPGECWLVGQRLPATDRHACTHRVQLQRSLDGRSLSFDLLAGSQRKVALPIPDERPALQLLKGQFEGEVSATQVKGNVPRVALTLAPIISSNGTHVALRLLDEPGMTVIKLPAANQKKAMEVRTALWTGGASALGMTFVKRSIGAILSEGPHLRFWNIGGLRPVEKPAPEALHLPPGTAALLPTAMIRDSNGSRLFLLDTKGRLATWALKGRMGETADEDTGKTRYTSHDVMSMAKVEEGTLAYVRREGTQLYACAVGVPGLTKPSRIGPADGVSQVLFIGGWNWRLRFGGCALCTVEDGSERWTVITASSFPVRAGQIELARGWRGIGLRQRQELYGMVMLGPDKRRVALYEDGQQRVLFTTSEEIVRFSYCPMSELVAVLTSARELLVYALGQDALRVQVLCNKTSETYKERARDW